MLKVRNKTKNRKGHPLFLILLTAGLFMAGKGENTLVPNKNDMCNRLGKIEILVYNHKRTTYNSFWL